MKRIALRLLLLPLGIVSIWLGGPLVAPAADGPHEFRAGTAVVDITPTKFPVIVSGGFEEQTANRVRDPLHARAFVLDDGATRLGIMVVDSLALSRELLDEVKAKAAKLTGIAEDHLLISATHTHSAPSTMGVLGSRADVEYAAWLIPQLVRALQLANENLQPARAGWAQVSAPQYTFCRRYIRRPDRMQEDPFGQQNVRANMHPGHESPDVIGPAGPADDELSLLALQTAEGKPLGVLANFSMHYVGATPISADYFGAFCEHLARRIVGDDATAACTVAMSQGTSGDSMWMNYSGPKKTAHFDRYADELSALAYRAYQQITYQDHVPLAIREAKLTLDRRVPDAERLAWAEKIAAAVGERRPVTLPEIYACEQIALHHEPQRELKLQAIRIGDLGITAIPNEVYGISGLKLKRQSPLAATFNIALANGCEGYIPPPEQHRLGGYTTWPARTAGLEVEAEPKIVEHVLALLEKVSGQPRRPIRESKSSYAEGVLAAQPRGYWRLSEMAGNVAHDATEHEHHARYEGNVAYDLPGPSAAGFAADKPANAAVHFAGGRLQAEVPNIRSIYSVEFWFWSGLPIDARPVTAYLFSRGPQGDPQAAADFLGLGGTKHAAGRLFFGNDAAPNEAVTGRHEIAPGSWNHVVLVRRGQHFQIYLNGQREPELEGKMPYSKAFRGEWHFAGRADNQANLEGKLDEIALYDRILTPEEISAHYRASGMPPMKDAAGPASLALQPTPKELTPDEGGPWQTLFDGKSLRGWYTFLDGQGKNHDPQRIFQAVDGVLHVYKDADDGKPMPFGYLATDKEYSHYHLKFEYRWGTKRFAPRTQVIRDTGILYHFAGPDVVWPRSVEYQIQEGDTGDIFAVYTRLRAAVDPQSDPAEPRFLEPSRGGRLHEMGDGQGVPRVVHSANLETDGWNKAEIIVRGDRAIHILNGRINNRCQDMQQPDPEHPGQFVPLVRGKILLQAEGAEVQYRNIQLRELAASPSAAPQETPLPQPTSASDSLARLKMPDGYEIQLVAAEPLVKDPVAIAWGADGKLWVAEMADYPLGLDNDGTPCGRIRYLEDTNGDGRYDQSTLFLENVNFPNGIIPWHQGVLVTAAPEIFYAEDTDNDGKADLRKTLYTGFIEGNPQLRVNGLQWGQDGWLYCANGWSGGVVKSEQTGKTVDIRGRDLRIDPDHGLLDQVAGVTEFGRNCNDFGDWFGCDNSNPIWHFVLEDRYTRRNPHVASPDARRQLMTPANPPVFPISQLQKRYHSLEQTGRFTSACGVMVYRDELLFPCGPEQHAFVCEPVHNLVHHEILTDEGVSFAAHRAPGEEQSEFLASTDPWFRPVMTRTGPDGALWVVDMYRYMIEHPEFLPPEGKEELRPFFRLGEDQGRIYRIVPKKTSARPVANLARLTVPQLVAALDSPNGTQRDLVQQLLTAQADPAAIAPLAKLASGGKNPAVRAQALNTLATMQRLTDDMLATALADSHPGVLRQAIRLSEQQEHTPAIESALVRLAKHPDDQVRLQLAASLGEWTSPATARTLLQLAQANADSPYLQSAVLSSIHAGNIGEVLAALLPEMQGTRPELVGSILELTAAFDRGDLVVEAINHLPAEGKTAWPQLATARMLRTLERRGQSFAKLATDQGDAGRQATARVETMIAEARSLAADPQADTARRIAAVQILGCLPEQRAADREALVALLVPQTVPEVSSAVVTRLAEQKDAAIADALLENWSGYGPALRKQILETIASRPEWIAVLLDRVEAKAIAPGDINSATRQRLAEIQDAALRDRANRILAVLVDADRQKVIESYQDALTLSGRADQGAVTFKKNCSVCHKLNGVGHEVGPNLAALTDKSSRAILQAILDPSRAVESRFASYIAVTTDGQVFTGMLATETGSHLTLLMQEGKQQTILREDLEEFSSTNKSLMPEGFERELKPQDVADLIAYINQSPANAPKQLAGNRPEKVRPAPDGELVLTAEQAEVFGDTLVFEPLYKNLGYWHSANDHAAWTVEVPQAGKYEVAIQYACPNHAARNQFELALDGHKLVGKVEGTGSFDVYQTHSLGTIKLPAGEGKITLRPLSPKQFPVFDVKTITFKPAGR